MAATLTSGNLKTTIADSLGELSIQLPKIKYPKHVVSGTTIDAVAHKNINSIKELTNERDSLKAELKEVKDLNERLFDRVDFLQQVIEKEASANTYFHNYPPKPDSTLKKDGPKNKVDKSDAEAAKLKELYENQIEMLRKEHDKQFRELKLSTAFEIENLTEQYSFSSRQLLVVNAKYEELDKQYKMYYMKSDTLIKEREA